MAQYQEYQRKQVQQEKQINEMQAAIESLTNQLSKNSGNYNSTGSLAKTASKAELDRVRLEAEAAIAQ